MTCERGSPRGDDMETSSPALRLMSRKAKPLSNGSVESAKPGNNCGPRPPTTKQQNAPVSLKRNGSVLSDNVSITERLSLKFDRVSTPNFGDGQPFRNGD